MLNTFFQAFEPREGCEKVIRGALRTEKVFLYEEIECFLITVVSPTTLLKVEAPGRVHRQLCKSGFHTYLSDFIHSLIGHLLDNI